jgi:hypothetical protein
MLARTGLLLAVLLGAVSFDAAAQEAPRLPGGGEAVSETASTVAPVDEVLVEAPEPRYVAPTLRDRIGRVWAPVLINGRGPFRLVLDTGANRSAVLPRVAESLGIPLGPSNMRVHGVTGTAIVSSIKVEQLEVGELLMGATTLPVVADVFGGADGVLGNEALGDKRIFIDFRRDRIEISRSRRQRLDTGFSKISLKLSQGRLLSFKTRIGSVPVIAVIDTGAQRTLGNRALREALNRRERKWQQEDVIGVTLDVERGDSIPTPPIAFGDASIRGLRVTFTDTFIFEHWKLTSEPAVLLGMDVLGLMDVLIIDYRTREMHVRLRS